jgi:outer membrane protein
MQVKKLSFMRVSHHLIVSALCENIISAGVFMDTRLDRLKAMVWAVTLVFALAGWCHPVLAAEPEAGAIKLEDLKVLDLPTAARIALTDNPSLAAARARVAQAEEAVRQARSTYWPRLDLGAAAARVTLSDSAYQSQLATTQALFPGRSVEDPENYYTASVTASWLLFNGFSRKFDLAAAQYGSQTSEAARIDAQRLLLSAVTRSFLAAQQALENVAIAIADEGFNQRQFTEARLRYEVGTGALSDVLNFEVKTNLAQSDRIVAERVYQTSRIGLAALLGVPQAQLGDDLALAPLADITDKELQAPQPELLLEAALTGRPDLARSDWGVQQAQAQVQSARGKYFPTLSLSATYDGERAGDAGFEGDDFGNTVALNLSYTLFAGGLNHARHQQAKARLYEVEKLKKDTEINVTSEVRTAMAQLGSAQKQLVLERTNAQLVQRNRDLVEKEYRAGVGSLVRLNEAQRDLTAAQVRLAASRAALHRAWYDLQSATGEILTTFN